MSRAMWYKRLSTTLLAVCLYSQALYHNPVIPGNNPDPSVIRVGKDYWATATATSPSPIFPLFHSQDLVRWEHVSDVFLKPPSWAHGKYWAPEISEYGGEYYVYYSARCDTNRPACIEDKDSPNPLCIGVATSARPDGPYSDSGKPLVCQSLGSIDAMEFAEGGKRYLIWKEDSNSCHCRVPTRIWMQPLSRDGLSLIGKRTELLQNDFSSWESEVVEGPYLLKHDGYYYLFYSGGACCGMTCNYGLGAARSRNLFGPYVKDAANPLLVDNSRWRCPGHGSIVSTPDGRTFLLHHAVPMGIQVFIRNAVLDEVIWEADEWPSINHHHGVSEGAAVP